MKFLSRTITFNEKELQEELGVITGQINALRVTLAEALEWIEHPVSTPEDAEYFLLFEERAKKLIAGE